ncbi:MAG: hypothetical protein ABIS51_10755 [Sphingomonas sp.]
MTIDAEADYHERAVQLAVQLRWRCSVDPSSEFPVFWVSNENGWTGPCDALCRLGVMERYRILPGKPWRPEDRIYANHVLAHRFATHWQPGEPLHLYRHSGEPSYTDLLRSLCNHAWFENLGLREIGIDRVGDDSPETAFIDDLVDRKLGSWSADRGFQFDGDIGDEGYTCIDSDYWRDRMALARQLGSEEDLFPWREKFRSSGERSS